MCLLFGNRHVQLIATKFAQQITSIENHKAKIILELLFTQREEKNQKLSIVLRVDRVSDADFYNPS